jgi:hypothetical protein
MGQPKKRTSHRRTGTRRSHMVQKLARRINATSPVRVELRTRKPSRTKETAHSKASIRQAE